MSTEDPKVTEASYTVVARRYRPKTFEQLIGQDHIAQALGQAIASGRVGHAYLFTGARGVGKTSTARIFAKALNTTNSETSEEIAAAIDSGEDIDVIEIDGASNRGIEEIRQLRANVNVRPSRATYKIYIIDEVHMLTNPAFNALLKTLEEPPSHVKFIFCTTDPDKIPITVLSRCQRFDFSPVKMEAIQARLREITDAEGYKADEEALSLLARRAAGSMRDSQSLLEQVMSFSAGEITVEQVHSLLGTADESRLQEFAEALMAQDSLLAIQTLENAVRQGSDAGQIGEQLLAYLRDIMTAGIGGDAEILKLASPASHPRLVEYAEQWGQATVLSAMQILDEALVRMRSSISSVTLMEVALVQICGLAQLASIPELLEQLSGARPNSAAQKKNSEPLVSNSNSAAGLSGDSSATASSTHFAVSSPAAPSASVQEMPASAPSLAETGHSTVAPNAASQERASHQSGEVATVSKQSPDAAAGPSEQTPLVSTQAPNAADASRAAPNRQAVPAASHGRGSAEALAQWQRALNGVDGLLSDVALMAERIEPVSSESWRVIFAPGATQPREFCEQPEKKIELQKVLAASVGRSIALSFVTPEGAPVKREVKVSQSAVRAQKLREMSNHPYVKRLCEVLGGEIVRVDPPRQAPPQASSSAVATSSSTTAG
ncbi:MAG: DNA polymerase III subunit gamma/tau [Pirellulaceae bacterium]